MKLLNSMPFPRQCLAPMQLNRLYNMKLHVFKSSRERTYNSDNENIYHPKFASYAERSSQSHIILRLMTTLEKSSLTGPQTFMVVFSHEKEDSVKK